MESVAANWCTVGEKLFLVLRVLASVNGTIGQPHASGALVA
jgi:hypothetical protein